jgi:hypothetical protein
MTYNDDVPKPSFAYQGSRLSLVTAGVLVGPFPVPVPSLGFGFNVAESSRGDNIRDYELRPARTTLEADPCTTQFVMFYQQKGVAWDMIFRITTDPKGGVVGTSFAMDVQSNYPEIYMSIPKIKVNQPAFGVLMRGDLPGDYMAQMTVSFWQNDLADPPIDSWLALETAYVDVAARGKKAARPEDIPMVPVGRTTLFPAHQGSKGKVLGDNYPK